MYWARSISADDLIDESDIGGGANVLAHGITRLNIDPNDIATFVRPRDAALMFGYRALQEGGSFEDSVVVWMATMRRRGQTGDAIVEILQRVFAQMSDQKSLIELLREITKLARECGYAKVWLTPSVFNEALLAPALAPITDELGHPVEHVPSTGMTALVVGEVDIPVASEKPWWRFW